MAYIKLKVEYWYGSYSVTTDVVVNEDYADKENIKAAVRKKHDLNFLPMYSDSLKIISQETLTEDY